MKELNLEYIQETFDHIKSHFAISDNDSKTFFLKTLPFNEYKIENPNNRTVYYNSTKSQFIQFGINDTMYKFNAMYKRYQIVSFDVVYQYQISNIEPELKKYIELYHFIDSLYSFDYLSYLYDKLDNVNIDVRVSNDFSSEYIIINELFRFYFNEHDLTLSVNDKLVCSNEFQLQLVKEKLDNFIEEIESSLHLQSIFKDIQSGKISLRGFKNLFTK